MIGRDIRARLRVRALPLCACLLFGAAANIVVAGLVALNLHVNMAGRGPMLLLPVPSAPVDALGLDSSEPTPTEFHRYAEFGWVYWDMMRTDKTDDGQTDKTVCGLWRFGWPMPSVQAQSCIRFVTTTPPKTTRLHGSGPIWWREGVPIAGVPVPVRPIWPGFFINTLIYAMLWPLVVYAIKSRRRRKRKREGLCPACGYSLQGLSQSAKCPECGTDCGVSRQSTSITPS